MEPDRPPAIYCLLGVTMARLAGLLRAVLLGALVCRASLLPAVPGVRVPALVLYGSQTGTAEDIALGLCRSPSSSSEEALYLPTFSHLLIVNKPLSLSLSLLPAYPKR